MKCRNASTISRQTKTTEQFILEAKLIHGNKYDYSKVQYTGAFNSLTIVGRNKSSNLN